MSHLLSTMQATNTAKRGFEAADVYDSGDEPILPFPKMPKRATNDEAQEVGTLLPARILDPIFLPRSPRLTPLPRLQPFPQRMPALSAPTSTRISANFSRTISR